MEGRHAVSTVTITRRGEERLRSGHPWIYRSDAAEVHAAGGDTVRVLGPTGRALGYALYSERSEISLRLLTRDAEEPTPDLWRGRLRAAIDYRSALEIDATAYRLVHSEGDRLPGLVVDRYGDYLVVQALSQGVDQRLPELTAMLAELLGPAGTHDR